MLYTYYTLIAMPGHQTKQKHKTIQCIIKQLVVIYNNDAIEPYNNNSQGLGSTSSIMSGGNPPLYCTFISITACRDTKTQQLQKRHNKLGCSLICYIGSRIFKETSERIF